MKKASHRREQSKLIIVERTFETFLIYPDLSFICQTKILDKVYSLSFPDCLIQIFLGSLRASPVIRRSRQRCISPSPPRNKMPRLFSTLRTLTITVFITLLYFYCFNFLILSLTYIPITHRQNLGLMCVT